VIVVQYDNIKVSEYIYKYSLMASSTSKNGSSHGVTEIKTVEQFVEAVSGNKLVVIDFWAPWCGPCKMIAPKYEEFSKKYTEATFYKINSDNKDLKQICDVCEVSSLPSFCFFRNTKCIKKIEGANELKLKETIKKNLHKEKSSHKE